MFHPLQARDLTRTFGAIPGQGEPYGYNLTEESTGGLIIVVNPAQRVATIELSSTERMRLLFYDAGFTPVINNKTITLGAEQMALIGVGSYAEASYDLGVQDDVIIPGSIRRLETIFACDGDKAITATVIPVKCGRLRIILRQCDREGLAVRTTGGSPPDGVKLGRILRLQVTQNNRDIPVRICYDKAIWSGLSWAVGEVDCAGLDAGQPLTISCATTEPRAVVLSGELYSVE